MLEDVGDYDPRHYDSVERGMKVATIALEKRVFKAPGHRVFFLRALIGLDSYLQQFGTVTNYHRLIEQCVAEAEERTAGRRATRSARGARRGGGGQR